MDFIEIEEDAVFIADAHYLKDLDSSTKQKAESNLIDYLNSLSLNPPKQVFLMGDISHILVGHLHSSIKDNKDLIKAINQLSQKTQVFYFEGNHDFGLDSRLLPKTRIYPRALQPAVFRFSNKLVAIAHGDIFLDKTYEFYIRILTSSLTLSILKIIDLISVGVIYKLISKTIQKKQVHTLLKDKLNDKKRQDEFLDSRFKAYQKWAKKQNLDLDLIIEGHFHLGMESKNVISLPCFYYFQKFFVLKSKLEIDKKVK